MAKISHSAAAAKIAMVEISVASAVIPAAWPIARIVYFNQCDPEAIMEKGSVEWFKLTEQLAVAHHKLDSAVAGLPVEQWSGEDRRAFEAHTTAYGIQVIGIQVLAGVVSVAMLSVGVILLCLVVAYAVISSILAVWAAFIVLAGATVVGAAASASALASANSFAASAAGVLRGLETAVTVTANAGAGAIAGAAAIDVGAHLGSGGGVDALKDLVQAAVDGLDDAAAGFLSKMERDFAGYGIHSSGRHAASPNGPGELMYGLFTQTAPTGGNGDGEVSFGTSGVVDNIWQRVFDGNAWNR